MKLLLRSTLCMFVLFFAVSSLKAQEVGGHIKFQSGASFYSEAESPDDTAVGQLDARLLVADQFESFSYDLHAETLGLISSEPFMTAGTAGVFASLSGIENREERRLFDATKDLVSSSHADMLVRIDRAAVTYHSGNTVIRIGRQALSWGNGLLFQVLDVVNPFSPADVIKAYKSGDDMLYGQWLAPGGEDIQGALLPRRDPVTGDVSDNESSFLLKGKKISAESGLSLDLLGGMHYDDALAGVGVSRPVGDALMRSDVLFTLVESGRTEASFLINIDRFWTVGERSLYTMLEYFYNGFGVDRERYRNLPPALFERLERGELFTLGQHYAGSSARLEITPLLQCSISAFLNIEDTAGLLQPTCTYELMQDANVILGLSSPFGGRGTEFGGSLIGTEALPAALFVETPHVIFSRLEFFF